MSVSIKWKIVKDEGHRVSGTSTDWTTFNDIFPSHVLTYADVEKLVAMHRATCFNKTLWGDLAAALNGLPEGTSIEVSAEW
jgi:hypothetical protein